MNDSDLLNLLKSRNNNAFKELVDSYRNKVINICYRFLLNKEDAEDVAQDVFVEIYHSIGKFREDSKLSTWIYRIAVTKSIDEIKKRKRKKRISSVGKLFGLEQIANLITGSERPDKTFEENESLELLMKALDNLPESQRIALTLSKIEGYTNPEIAEIMQTTVTAVDSLIYRAKQNLKASISNKR